MRLQINDVERDELLKILKASLMNTRVEVRRTRTPDYHDKLVVERDLLASLIEKLEAPAKH